MRFVMFRHEDRLGIAVRAPGGGLHGLHERSPEYPGSLQSLIAAGSAHLRSAHELLLAAPAVDESRIAYCPPLETPGKIICVGLNYADHSAESGFKQPEYPTLFGRFASSLVGHGAPMVRPVLSEQLDYEGEVVAVIGKGGKHIARAAALDHVAGYSLFNEGSVRDYQFKSPQWTMGKNFDGTGAFGPEFVTADELPPGVKGLRLETRLNGHVMQSASTDDMVFDVATLVSTISEAITLEPGDLIVTGTPAGVGAARKPPVWMQPGDVCEVEVERIGILRNQIVDEARPVRAAA